MKLSKTNRRRLSILGPVAFFALLGAWLIWATATEPLDSFAACAKAGYVVLDSNPPVCRAPGRNFIGPLSTPAPTPAAVANQDFQLLVDGNSEGKYPRGWQLIASQSAWQKYWSDVHASVTLPPLIHVDFSTSVVVAVSEGVRPTSGYKMVITGIGTSTTGTSIDLTETTPVGCAVTQTPTNPYFIVQTARLPTPITYQITQARHECSNGL